MWKNPIPRIGERHKKCVRPQRDESVAFKKKWKLSCVSIPYHVCHVCLGKGQFWLVATHGSLWCVESVFLNISPVFWGYTLVNSTLLFCYFLHLCMGRSPVHFKVVLDWISFQTIYFKKWEEGLALSYFLCLSSPMCLLKLSWTVKRMIQVGKNTLKLLLDILQATQYGLGLLWYVPHSFAYHSSGKEFCRSLKVVVW